MSIEASKQSLIQVLSAQAVSPTNEDFFFNGVCAASSAVHGGEACFCLSFDKNSVTQAFSRGASLLVLSHADAEGCDQMSPEYQERVLLVEDVEAAFFQLAAWWLQKIEPSITVVSGSVGKTCTREFLSRLYLSQERGQFTLLGNTVRAAAEAIFRLGADDRWLILEIAPLNLAALSRLLPPKSVEVLVLSCDSIAPDTMKSFSALLSPAVVAIVPETEASGVPGLAVAQVATFGSSPGADLSVLERSALGLRGVRVTLRYREQHFDVTMALPSWNVAKNLLPALLATILRYDSTGMNDHIAVLQKVSAIPGRCSYHRLYGDRYLIEDTHHGGLESWPALEEMLDRAITLKLDSLLIVGSLGDCSIAAAEFLGDTLVKRSPGCVISIGDFGTLVYQACKERSIPCMHAVTPEAAAHTALKLPFQLLYIKGIQSDDLSRMVETIVTEVGEVLEIPNNITPLGTDIPSDDT